MGDHANDSIEMDLSNHMDDLERVNFDPDLDGSDNSVFVTPPKSKIKGPADEILFRASSVGYIMVEPKETSPFKKWEEAFFDLNKAQGDYNAIENKKTKTAAKKLASIEKLKKTVAKLHETRHELHLSESTKTHLVDVFVRNEYNRFTEITAKQLDKGNETEEDSITTVSRIRKQRLRKNEESLKNEFICGTPDIYIGESIENATEIIDTKSSWDAFTFFRAINKPLDQKYYYQGMSYMALTGATKCTIAYCLNNTPYHLVSRELLMESYKHEEGNTPAWIEIQIIANHVYDKETFMKYIERRGIMDLDENAQAVIAGFVEIPLDKRYYGFEFERDEAAIDRIYDRVKECREYMNKHLFKVLDEVPSSEDIIEVPVIAPVDYTEKINQGKILKQRAGF